MTQSATSTPDATPVAASTPTPAIPVAGNPTPRRRGDRGEGVISAAIAVLIIAFLGAAMWVGFNSVWKKAETNINTQVNTIGNQPSNAGG